MVNRNIQELTHATAYDKGGEKLGSVKQVYIDDATGQPDFVEVGHGLFGMNSSLVPLRGHQLNADELRLSFTKDRIKDAPDIDDDAHLTDADQALIYRHYGLEGIQNTETYDADLHDRERRTEQDAPGFRGTADEDSSLTLSEERVNVDKERVQTGAVRLRKYVVHDTETVDVPVEREEVRLERTPVDGKHAVPGGRLGEDEASVTLSEERVNVTKETVPVEEVSLHKEAVRGTETVSEDVAREELDVDGAVDVDVDGDPTLRR